MELRILGPLEVLGDRGPVAVPGAKCRALLALLVVHANHVVAVDQLVDDLWDGAPPDSATATLQGYVYQLRRAVPDLPLRTHGGGYVVDLAADALDATRFDALLREATVAAGSDAGGAVALVDEALDMWRGPALVDFRGTRWADAEAARLEERRLEAIELRVEARLRAGDHAAAVPDLEALVRTHPLRERFWAQLMLALYRCDRQADALRAYTRLRDGLAAELGIEPSREIARLESAILQRDPALDLTAAAVRSVSTEPLSAEAVADLLRDVLPDDPDAALVAAVHAESGGDPRLVRELAARLRDRAITDRLERAVARADAARDDLSAVETMVADALRRPGAGDEPATTGAACPYKGLAPFESSDASCFVGREGLVATLIARVAVERVVTVLGASGSGKSSLVRAGLVPALRAGALPGSSAWRIEVTSPSSTTAEQLRDALRTSAGERAVVVLDQLEELVTMPASDARDALVSAVRESLTGRDTNAVVVLVVRADHYGELASSGVGAAATGAPIVVRAMSDDELRRAVLEPARRAGLDVEPGLADAVVHDAAGEPGALPLVSTALLETWVRRRGRLLSLDGYRDAGGVQGALARLADDAYDALDDDDRIEARHILVRLAAPGTGFDDVRRRVARRELTEGSRTDAVLRHLTDRRLVTVEDDAIDVAHEALFRHWPRLAGWLADDREGRRIHEQLRTAAIEWDGRGRDESDLYRGARLAAAREWAAAHDDEPNAVERAFVDASAATADADRARERRGARRLRALTAAMAVLLVAALLAASLALAQRRHAAGSASRARRTAIDAELSQITSLASTLPPEQTDLALLLGVEARRLQPGPATEGALETALVHTPVGLDRMFRLASSTVAPAVSSDGQMLAVPTRDGRVRILDVASGRVRRTFAAPSDRGLVAVFSGDDSLLALSGGATVDVVDVDTGTQIGAPIEVGGAFGYAVFDPTDARRLFAISIDDAGLAAVAGEAPAQLTEWDRTDPDHPARLLQRQTLLQLPNSPVMLVDEHATFAAVGGSGGGHTQIVDLATGAVAREVDGAPVAFMPRSSLLVTSNGDHLLVWDARTGAASGASIAGPAIASGPGRTSADGRRIAVVDVGHGIRVYDVTSRRALGDVVGFAGDLPIGFLPDGRVATAGPSLVSVWDVDGAAPPTTLRLDGGQQGPVYGEFVAPGDVVMTEGILDGTLALWDARTGARRADRGFKGAHPFASVTADGKVIAAPGDGSDVGLWDRQTGERLSTISAGGGGVGSGVAWLGPGRSLLTWTDGQVVHLWDATDPRHPVRRRDLRAPGTPPPGTPSSLYTSQTSDGRAVAIVDQALSTITTYDGRSGDRRWSRSVAGSVLQASFSPDGATLAVVHFDAFSIYVVELWDGRDGHLLRSFTPHALRVTGVEFVRRGAALVLAVDGAATSATGALDTAGLQLVDVSSLQTIGSPMPIRAAGSVFVSRDASSMRVVGGSGEGRALIWDVDRSHWASVACTIVGRTLTRAEWARYLPARAYDPPCR